MVVLSSETDGAVLKSHTVGMGVGRMYALA
ncbi:MAG: hypothetical protein ACI8W3_000057 [Myxococcota bacterium]|jgi:hypothetical protein